MNTPVKFDSLFLIDIVKKYFKHLVIIGIGAVILSVVFTSEYFITPMYRSEAIVYPQNLIPYSTESPTEQMLQLLESNYIRDGLIEDFNLYEHYEIKKDQKYPQTVLFNMMKDNVSIDKTKYESVEIVVMDKDPVIASQMVDSIVSKFNTKARNLQREKTAEVVIILKNQLDYWQHQMDSMENALRDIRMNYGILDFEEQMSSFSRVYYTAVKEGRAGGGERPLDKVMSNMQEKGGEAVSLKEHLWRVRGTYNDIKVQYEDVVKDMNKELTYSNLVTKPVPAERKSYPVRSLMVLMFTASVLFFSLLVMVIMENNRRLRSTS
jgi:hypothetical protein